MRISVLLFIAAIFLWAGAAACFTLYHSPREIQQFFLLVFDVWGIMYAFAAVLLALTGLAVFVAAIVVRFFERNHREVIANQRHIILLLEAVAEKDGIAVRKRTLPISGLAILPFWR